MANFDDEEDDLDMDPMDDPSIWSNEIFKISEEVDLLEHFSEE